MMTGESPSYDLNGFVQFVLTMLVSMYTNSMDTTHFIAWMELHCIPSAATIGTFGKVPIKTYNVPTVPGLKSITIKDVTILLTRKQNFNPSVH